MGRLMFKGDGRRAVLRILSAGCFALSLVFFGFPDAARANESSVPNTQLQVRLTGTIWTSGCGIEIGETSSIEFGNLSLEKFQTPDVRSEVRNFSVKLGCSLGEVGAGIIGYQKARLTLEDGSQLGIPYSEKGLRTERGVVVQVGFNAQDPIAFQNGVAPLQEIPGLTVYPDEDPYGFNLYAWVTPSGDITPTPGEFNATLTLRLEYY